MAVSRRSFLMFAAKDAQVYAAPAAHKVGALGEPDDVAGEKCTPPVPVGAGSAGAFLRKCVGCMRCVPVCPSGILKASTIGSHFARPALDFRAGWCRTECDECARVCPAGAIVRGMVGELKKAQRTGIAVWHAERCVAARGVDACSSCARRCPSKAITLVPREGAGKNAPLVPKVDPAKCCGCGKCEFSCPARPKAAMTVEGRP